MTTTRVPDDELDEARLAFVVPRYGSGTLADVIGGVCAALGMPGVSDPLGIAARHPGLRRAIVLLVDGLGHHQVPLLAPVAPVIAGGYADRYTLTAGFPSTTPASLAAIGTGVATGRHGIVGFTVRVPETGVVLNHIRWAADPPPASWQPVPTLFERARLAGITPYVVSRPQFAGTGITVAAYRGAGYVGADGPDALAEATLATLGAAEAPALVYAYHPNLDAAGHASGVGSADWFDRAAETDRLVARLAAGLTGDAALFVTADHGQLNVPDEARTDFDLDPALQAGVATFAGEARVRYLHTLPGAAPDVIAAWRSVLGDTAIVMPRDEAIATGWYGEVSPAHRERIGDVVAVALGRAAVVASRTAPTEAPLIAMHGSLTAAEMEIPLLVYRPAG